MIDNRKQFVTEVLFLCVASNKITQQKLGYNCEYAREDILADSYVSVFNSHDFFIKINSSIWSHLLLGLFMKQKRLQKRIQNPVRHLRIIFLRFFFFLNVVLVVWCETYFHWKLFAFLFKLYIKESQIWDTLPKSKMELFVTLGTCKVIFCKLVICTYCIALWVCLFSVSSLPVPFYSRWFHANIWESAFCDNNYCECCLLLANGI